MTQHATPWREVFGSAAVYVDGWETRTASGDYQPEGLVLHHTAGPHDKPGMRRAPSLEHIVPSNLSQLYVDFDGRWYVVAARKSSHCGWGVFDVVTRLRRGLPPAGDAKDVYPPGIQLGTAWGNEFFVGIEVESPGDGTPWPVEQYRSVLDGLTLIFRHYGWNADRLVGHREWTARKIDPLPLSMPDVRADLAERLDATRPPRRRELMLIPDPNRPGSARKPRVLRLDVEGKAIVGHNGARLRGMVEGLGLGVLPLPAEPLGWYQGEAGRVNVLFADGTAARYDWA